jgi:hypothetical protein
MEIKVNARKGGKSTEMYWGVIEEFYKSMQELHGVMMYPDLETKEDVKNNVRDYLFPNSAYNSVIEPPSLYDISDQCLMNIENLREKVARKRVREIGESIQRQVDESLIKGDGKGVDDPTLESLVQSVSSLNWWLPKPKKVTGTGWFNNDFVMKYIDDSSPEVSDTEAYWMDVTDEAREIMLAKNDDYGEVWKEMLPTSLVDEILIKARRSRNLMQKHYAGEEAKVSEGILSELRDMINYCVFAHWAWSQEIQEDDSE